MASVIETTKAATEVLGGPVAVRFVETTEPGTTRVAALKAIAVRHPPANPHKVLSSVEGAPISVPDAQPSVKDVESGRTLRSLVELAALDSLMQAINARRWDNALAAARALVAANPEPPDAA